MKKFRIFEQNKHEYDVLIEESDEGTVYSLHYSDSNRWTHPNELILSAKDDRNQVKFSQKLGKELDYSSCVELKILLNIISIHDKNFTPRYEAIEFLENRFFV